MSAAPLPVADTRILAVVVTRGQCRRAIGAEGVVARALQRERIRAPRGRIGVETGAALVEAFANIRNPALLHVDEPLARWWK